VTVVKRNKVTEDIRQNNAAILPDVRKKAGLKVFTNEWIQKTSGIVRIRKTNWRYLGTGPSLLTALVCS
jgi:hypothetical protein